MIVVFEKDDSLERPYLNDPAVSKLCYNVKWSRSNEVLHRRIYSKPGAQTFEAKNTKRTYTREDGEKMN